jgi:Putative prokaryotic signal transducing protein
MKKILSVTNRAEAHLLAEALRQDGIPTSVQEEWGSLDGTSTTFIWIENDGDAERATALLAEMTGKRQPAAVAVRSSRKHSGFVRGLLLGVLLGALAGGALAVWRLNGRYSASSNNWDSNGDGSADGWATYNSAGQLVESTEDRNFDGAPDSWMLYKPPGVLNVIRYDQDFDRREDYWESCEKGIPVSFTADNDRDGVVDEWGRFENGKNGVVLERNWSFSNDRVTDKRAFFSAGRKTREEYDRDRDGVFEETILFDEFERVVSRR